MINNDYPFSLLLSLKIQGIRHLMDFCPLEKTLAKKHFYPHFEQHWKDVFKHVKGSLASASSSVVVPEVDLEFLATSVTKILGDIAEDLLSQKRRNVVTSLKFLEIEFKGMLSLLQNHER